MAKQTDISRTDPQQAPPPAKQSKLLELMAARYGLDPTAFFNTLKATIMKPGKDGQIPSNEEIASFLVVANKYQLDPFTKEIYAFPDRRAGIVPVVGVDGFVTLALRNPDYNGLDIQFSDQIVETAGARPCPEWCEVKVYRKNLQHPVTVREYLDEVYCPPKGGYPGPWQTHTKRMLRHKSLIQALRMAFGISGVYDEDEADGLIQAQVASAAPATPIVTLASVEKKKAVTTATETKPTAPVPEKGEAWEPTEEEQQQIKQQEAQLL